MNMLVARRCHLHHIKIASKGFVLNYLNYLVKVANKFYLKKLKCEVDKILVSSNFEFITFFLI